MNFNIAWAAAENRFGNRRSDASRYENCNENFMPGECRMVRFTWPQYVLCRAFLLAGLGLGVFHFRRQPSALRSAPLRTKFNIPTILLFCCFDALVRSAFADIRWLEKAEFSSPQKFSLRATSRSTTTNEWKFENSQSSSFVSRHKMLQASKICFLLVSFRVFVLRSNLSTHSHLYSHKCILKCVTPAKNSKQVLNAFVMREDSSGGKILPASLLRRLLRTFCSRRFVQGICRWNI